MSAQADYIRARTRERQREDYRRRRAHARVIAARVAEIKRDITQRQREEAAANAPIEPDWLTAARRNQLDADTKAFAPKWKEMSRG